MVPSPQTNQTRRDKQSTDEGPCVPQLQSCKQAGGLWKYRRTGGGKGAIISICFELSQQAELRPVKE